MNTSYRGAEICVSDLFAGVLNMAARYKRIAVIECVLFAAIALQSAGADSENTKCTAQEVYEGFPASVTCFYARDISLIPSVTYSVDFYPSENSPGDEILSCNRVNSGGADCKVSPGYTFDKKINNTLTLGIKSASKSNTGRYACKVMSSDFKPDLDTCTFRLAEGPPPTTPTTPSSPKSEEEGVNTTFLIIGIVVAVTILAGATIAAVFLIRRCRLNNQRNRSHTTDPLMGDETAKAADVAPGPNDMNLSETTRRAQEEMESGEGPEATGNDNSEHDETERLIESNGPPYEFKVLPPALAPRKRDAEESSPLTPEGEEDTATGDQPSPILPEKNRVEGADQKEEVVEEPEEATKGGALTDCTDSGVNAETSDKQEENGSGNVIDEKSIPYHQAHAVFNN